MAQSVADPDLPGAPARLETIPAGSLVIPMDNSLQALSGTPFNMKAYGLVNALLHTNIPVKWAIATGKAKDGIDFTAEAQRLFPTVLSAAAVSFRSGPFIIHRDFTNRALSVITNFGSQVAVYRLASDTTVDVRYTIAHKPRVAVLDDGNTQKIHTDILDEAGFRTDQYQVLHAADVQFLPVASCFTLVTSPHFDGGITATNQTRSIREFIADGGNFLAQCAAVRTYENNREGHFHSNLGFADDNSAKLFTYPNADMPFNQFQGDLADEGGSLQDWRLAAGSTFTNQAYAQAQKSTDTNAFRAGVSKLLKGKVGSVVFYLGGHSYDGNALSSFNGRRMYLNALFVPPDRPADCVINFQTDLGISKTDGLTVVTNGQHLTYTVVVTNYGPGRVTGATIRDRLPSGAANVSWTADVLGGATVAALSGNGDIDTTANLPIHSSVIFTIQATVATNASCQITNLAMVATPAAMTDSDPGNNTAVDVDFVASPISAPRDLFVSCITEVPPPATNAASFMGQGGQIGGTCCGSMPIVTYIGDTSNGGRGCQDSPLIITRTYQITSGCNETRRLTQAITVIDLIPPMITCASNRTVDPGTSWSFDPPIATDVCDSNTTITVVNTVTNGLCGDAFTVTRTWRALDDCGNAAECSQTIIVPARVVIVTPPASQTNCTGNTAMFAVTASGTGLSYQWFEGAVPIIDETNRTLALSNLVLSDAGTYSVVVGIFCGNVVTNSATLTVLQSIAVLTPPANQTSFVGNNVTFGVTATGTDLRYRWIFGGTLLGTNSTLLLSNLTTNQAGTYCVIISGACGSPITNCATLTIQNRAPRANDDGYATLEDATLTIGAPGVLANDLDVDGDSLTTLILNNPTHGTLTLNPAGGFVYVPNANYFGADSFTYVARDGRTSSVPALVHLTVSPVNDAPSFVGGGDQKVNENSPMQTVNWASNISPGPANESAQSTMFFVSNDNPGLFALIPAIAPDGALRYKPATNAFGVATVRVTLRDNGGTANGGVDTSSEVTFRITVNSPPAVDIVTPLDGSVLMHPATFSVVADANDPDGTVTNVLFLVNGAAFTNVAEAPFYFVMTNAAPGNFQFRAVATDDCGLAATSAVVNVTVVTNAVIATGALVLNHQNGLFEQFVIISNATSETWASGVRLLVENLDSTNRVYNFSGTNAGIPYLDGTLSVAPGGLLTLKVQYYVPNPRTLPKPTLVAMPLPFIHSVAPKIVHVEPSADERLQIHFTSQDGRFYFLQYSDDLVRWKTDPIRMTGAGTMTIAPAHKAGARRFYRVLLIP